MRLCLNVFKPKLTVNSFFPTNLHKKVSDPARGLIGTAFALPLNRVSVGEEVHSEKGVCGSSVALAKGGRRACHKSVLSTPTVVVSSKSGLFTWLVISLFFREVDESFPDLEWHVQCTPM